MASAVAAQALSSLIKPPTFKGEKGKFVPWKMKFVTFLGTTGCAVALQKSFEKSLPAAENTALDEKDPSEKLMMALIMALENEDDMSIVISVRQRDADWPTGKAWKVWERIEDEYQPTDTTSKIEML
jgi:hypothetical protein